jgi:hypothetical protein
VRKLHIHVLGEQLLGAMILLVVSLLGTMQPGIGQWLSSDDPVFLCDILPRR